MPASNLIRRLLRDRIYAGALAALVLIAIISASAGGSDAASAPPAPSAVATATDTPRPSPTAVPTPELWQQLLDARRQLDLATLGDALATYRARFGTYPSTGAAVASLCRQRTDAGCALSKVRAGLPYGDGTYDYLYRSDGATFTLYTRLESPLTSDECGTDHPPALAGTPVYCKTGGP
jgi:hypothetical protein